MLFERLGFSKDFINCIMENSFDDDKIESDEVLFQTCDYDNQLDPALYIIKKTDEPICNVICSSK